MAEQEGGTSLAELIIPIAAIGFTVYYIMSVSEGPMEAKFSAYVVGIPLLITSAIFLLNRLWRLSRQRRLVEPQGRFALRTVNVKRLLLLALTMGYVLIIDYGVGFTLSNLIFLTCAILLLTDLRRPLIALGVAVALSACGYLLFIVAFNTRFPEGPIERALERLFG